MKLELSYKMKKKGGGYSNEILKFPGII